MNRKAKIVLIGVSCTGKTSLASAMKGIVELCDHGPTLGVDLYTFDQFQLWDTAGNESFKAITRVYLRGCDAIVWCKSESWWEDHYTLAGLNEYRNVLVILETRVDESHTDKVQKFAEDNGIPYIGACSSKSRVGIQNFIDFCNSFTPPLVLV